MDLTKPNSVLFHFDLKEIEKAAIQSVLKQTGITLPLILNYDEECTNNIKVHLTEGELTDSERKILHKQGYNSEDMNSLQKKIFSNLFHPKHISTAHPHGVKGERFDVVVQIPYLAYLNMPSKEHKSSHTSINDYPGVGGR
ncbi:hypothetical protein [Halobacillus yeomjeoni]|uniref:Uncharacterized protein n=1 Tax=Halobacillus yeomjeoni TaxID=311194 RepID=A0A931HU13_9BACI|nr:hypothetical protein [Halobacillus yeomjeoni]MBH0229540.1 hypothetical protein [Halobacillus yeomjeoni]